MDDPYPKGSPDMNEWEAMSREELIQLVKSQYVEFDKIGKLLGELRNYTDNHFSYPLIDMMSRGEIEDAVAGLYSRIEDPNGLKNYY
jgi:hypothetical protein